MSTLVRHCAQFELTKLWECGTENAWKAVKNDGFLKQNFELWIFPDSLEGEEIDSKAMKIQKSNNLINPRRPLVRNLLLNCLKCLNLPILRVWSSYLIKLLHLVDFSCWGPKVRFLGYLGAILGQTLETRFASTLQTKSVEKFKTICSGKLCSWGDSWVFSRVWKFEETRKSNN